MKTLFTLIVPFVLISVNAYAEQGSMSCEAVDDHWQIRIAGPGKIYYKEKGKVLKFYDSSEDGDAKTGDTKCEEKIQELK